MKPVRVGLIGCGRIAKRHVEALAHNVDLELAAVCDIVPHKMDTLAEDYVHVSKQHARIVTAPSKITGYQKMLRDTELDAVAICTESGYCAQIALDALHAGKHVLVEKSMALS